jgi:hypothetical protein
MTKHSFLAIALGAGLAIGPTVGANPLQGPEQREQRQSKEFHFSPEASSKLREHYKTNFREHDKVDVGHRAGFTVGGRLPDGWKGRIHAVPSAMLAEIGAIPAGLAVGYLDGYAVVYDPGSGEIVEVLDVY